MMKKTIFTIFMIIIASPVFATWYQVQGDPKKTQYKDYIAAEKGYIDKKMGCKLTIHFITHGIEWDEEQQKEIGLDYFTGNCWVDGKFKKFQKPTVFNLLKCENKKACEQVAIYRVKKYYKD